MSARDVGRARVGRLLRGDVLRRAHERRPPAVSRARPAALAAQPGQAEVEDLDDPPCGVSIRFCGLMSRWTMPCSRACCNPSAAWRTHWQASATGSGPCARTSSARLTPSTYSMTRKCRLAGLVGVVGGGRCSGGRAWPAALTSRAEARPGVGLSEDGGVMTLRATGRSMSGARPCRRRPCRRGPARARRGTSGGWPSSGGRPGTAAAARATAGPACCRGRDGGRTVPSGRAAQDLTQEGIRREALDGGAAVGAGLQVGGDHLGLGRGQLAVPK